MLISQHLFLSNAGDRNRTGTGGKSRRILSPVRLPVPPRRHPIWISHFRAMGRGGFEPPKALLTDLQSAPFGHSGTYPFSPSFYRLNIYNTLFIIVQ